MKVRFSDWWQNNTETDLEIPDDTISFLKLFQKKNWTRIAVKIDSDGIIHLEDQNSYD